MNGLMTQLMRIEPGKNIEESHMRNRQLIANWVYQKSQADGDHAVEFRTRNGKTFVVINDYRLVQKHLGELLAEIQRIKSTGDYAAAQNMVETYAVKVDRRRTTSVGALMPNWTLLPTKVLSIRLYASFDKRRPLHRFVNRLHEGYAEQPPALFARLSPPARNDENILAIPRKGKFHKIRPTALR